MRDPQPQLRAADLGGGRVFHQVVDGGGTDPAQPRVQVRERDPDIRPDTGLGHAAALDRQIDQLVYELYGLTKEEIAIVESSVEG